MKIGLIDVDGKLPNLALMKTSCYYKALGEQVEFVQAGRRYDKVYASCLFTWNRRECEKLKLLYPNIEIGGTGWNTTKELPQEIENCTPDYELYTIDNIYPKICKGIKSRETTIKKAETIVNMGIGFTSRGCIRNCGFCFVPKKEGQFRQVAEIKDILNPRSNIITLLDNNFTADPNMIDKCQEIKERDLIVDISQGIDVRVLTEEKAKALSEIKHLRSIHYAWDLMNFEKTVMEGIRLLSKHIKPYRHMCFMLVGYDTTFEEDMYRYRKLDELNIRPYVMIYNHEGDIRLKHFARWVNSRICKACEWEEYLPWLKSQEQLKVAL